MEAVPRLLILFGVILLGLGLLWHYFGDALPIGKLPGDYVIQKGGATIYLPLGTCIALSIVISVVFYVIRGLGYI